MHICVVQSFPVAPKMCGPWEQVGRAECGTQCVKIPSNRGETVFTAECHCKRKNGVRTCNGLANGWSGRRGGIYRKFNSHFKQAEMEKKSSTPCRNIFPPILPTARKQKRKQHEWMERKAEARERRI